MIRSRLAGGIEIRLHLAPGVVQIVGAVAGRPHLHGVAGRLPINQNVGVVSVPVLVEDVHQILADLNPVAHRWFSYVSSHRGPSRADGHRATLHEQCGRKNIKRTGGEFSKTNGDHGTSHSNGIRRLALVAARPFPPRVAPVGPRCGRRGRLASIPTNEML